MSEEPKKKKTRKPRASKKKAEKSEEKKEETKQVKVESKEKVEEVKTQEKPEEKAEEKLEEKKEEKKDLPKKPELTPEQIEEISKRVEIPEDQTPQYKPKIILSPEFGGTSNYEIGIQTVKQEVEEKLKQLQNSPDANPQDIRLAEEDLKTLDYLYQNYYIGMNVFRTAKGGREKIRE